MKKMDNRMGKTCKTMEKTKMDREVDAKLFAAPPRLNRYVGAGGETIWRNDAKPQYLEVAHVDRALGATQAVTCTDFYHTRMHRESYYQRREAPGYAAVEMVLRGRAYYGDGGNRYAADAGDICLLHPGRTHEIIYHPGEPCEKYGLVFAGPLLATVLAALGLEGADCLRVDQAAARELVEELLAAMRRADGPLARHRIAGRALTLLHFLGGRAEHRDCPPLAARARERLEADYARPLSMQGLAAELHTTLPTLNRVFEAATGATPYQYLIRVRMRRALAMLGQRRWRVKEIARLVGYRDPLHFSAEFRRLYGKPPREYAKGVAVGL